jgi:hypothetical protein
MPATPQIEPIPPRYWWLKRILAGALLLLIVLVGVRVWWGVVAERRLQRKIDEYRATGQPLLPEDFAVAKLPDAQNAAHFLNLAGQALTPMTTSSVMSYYDVSYDPALAMDYPEYVNGLIANEAQPLRLIRQARQAPACDWGVLPNMNSLTASIPSHSSLGALARLGVAAAVVRHHRGNDAEAVECLNDVLSIGDRCSEFALIISHLTTISIQSLAMRKIEYLAPALEHERSRRVRNGRNPARRGAVQRLIGRLLDDGAQTAMWRRSMLGERALQLDEMLSLFQGRVGISRRTGTIWFLRDGAAALFLEPLWKMRTVEELEELSIAAGLATVGNWQAAKRMLPGLPTRPWESRGYNRVQALIDPLQNDSYLVVFGLHLQSVAVSRMAATVLAIRLYELDHGRRPDQLSELVPAYLPSLPTDPFAAGDQALRYLPGADVPVVYSVWLDGIDHRGREAFKANAGLDRERSDLRFRLNREDIPRPEHAFTQPATMPASKKAAENQPQVKADERNAQQRQPPGDKP